jgi:putative transposase
MESAVRRHGRLRGQTAEDAGRGEHAAEAAAGRCHARQCGTEGFIGKEVVMPAAERRAVAHLKEAFGMSERRPCKAIGCCRMTIRYESTRPDDRDLRERMKAIAHERRRFGFPAATSLSRKLLSCGL